ncbi:nuclear transport factor 2 family protein [Frankia sp. Ag45/Mut15]|uniref:Nuclear transport factor 2 family protein n=1 Tax=Frankia umida TaxID=573489 RepID=A0ABT0JX86_9ACTN|nr:nuclear transport factor 2 family protein [Frankia umida]MCK9875934.1 nuclear transport factor 2 family protein [Frankia umida]
MTAEQQTVSAPSQLESVERYLAAWNTTGDVLDKAVAAALTEDATYVDPLSDVTGHEALATLIRGVQQQFTGYEFRLTGSPDIHHQVARFGWELVSRTDGSAPVAGFDVVTFATDGRIRTVTGFLDRVPGA